MSDSIADMLVTLNEIMTQYVTSLRSEIPVDFTDPREPREDNSEKRKECARILEQLMPVTSPEQVLTVRDALNYVGEELGIDAPLFPGYGESSTESQP